MLNITSQINFSPEGKNTGRGVVSNVDETASKAGKILGFGGVEMPEGIDTSRALFSYWLGRQSPDVQKKIQIEDEGIIFTGKDNKEYTLRYALEFSLQGSPSNDQSVMIDLEVFKSYADRVGKLREILPDEIIDDSFWNALGVGFLPGEFQTAFIMVGMID